MYTNLNTDLGTHSHPRSKAHRGQSLIAAATRTFGVRDTQQESMRYDNKHWGWVKQFKHPLNHQSHHLLPPLSLSEDKAGLIITHSLSPLSIQLSYLLTLIFFFSPPIVSLAFIYIISPVSHTITEPGGRFNIIPSEHRSQPHGNSNAPPWEHTPSLGDTAEADGLRALVTVWCLLILSKCSVIHGTLTNAHTYPHNDGVHTITITSEETHIYTPLVSIETLLIHQLHNFFL